MIIEQVSIRVKPGEGAQLEAAVVKAQAVFRQAEGCLGMELGHCVEDPERYVLLIRWTTVEAHVEGFRNSPLFQEWRGLAGPHFAEPPQVLHFEVPMAAVGF